MKLSICKHCNEEFNLSDKCKGWMANHSRWCKSNPKRINYIDKASKLHTFKTDETKQKISIGIKAAHNRGRYKHIVRDWMIGRKHSEESKKRMSESALKSNHRRLRRKIIEYNGVMLDSTWELILAKRLDELNIEWNRPSPIPWIDKEGIKHNYFPDFYLPKYNLFLDPKNRHAFCVQQSKIDILNDTYCNIIWITTIEGCKNFNILEAQLDEQAVSTC